MEPAKAYSLSAHESRPRPAMSARGVTRGTTRPARRRSPFRPPALIAQGAAGGAWGACQLVVASVREGDSGGAPQPLWGDSEKPPTTPSISSGQIQGYGAGIVTTAAPRPLRPLTGWVATAILAPLTVTALTLPAVSA